MGGVGCASAPPAWQSGGSSRSCPGRRRFVVVAATGMAILMVTIDSTIVATALRTLTRELHTSLAWSSWTITIYQLGEIVSLPVAGRLSDSLGRRRMFLVYVGTFTAASLLAGLATNISVLIALRFVQALGGGGLMPSAMGVVSDLFTRERDRALGLVTSLFPVGALLGPMVGGLILTYASWRGIFFVNVPMGAVLIVLLWILLPRGSGAARARIDVLGAGLLAGALLGVMLGLNQLGERGAGSALPWALLAAGGVLVTAFLVHERRAPQAILPPALLRRPAFAVVNGINVLYGAVFGIFSLVPAFAQLAYGFSPLAAGSLLALRAAGLALLSVTSSMLLRRLGYRALMAAGFLVLATGLTLLSLPPPGAAGPVAWLALSAVVCGVGVGIAGPPSNNASVQLLPDQVAAISGLRAMFRQTGGIIAITLTTLTIGSGLNQATALGRVFAVFAALTILMVPALLGVPERRGNARGADEP
ncbi:MAG TPA: MFS transporter [Candidatus Dormibacteraeota bacterium]|nr:MFS transporter [Candidatus Dormibacteraeota bacterium]